MRYIKTLSSGESWEQPDDAQMTYLLQSKDAFGAPLYVEVKNLDGDPLDEPGVNPEVPSPDATPAPALAEVEDAQNKDKAEQQAAEGDSTALDAIETGAQTAEERAAEAAEAPAAEAEAEEVAEYDEWTVEDLKAEASARDIAGRSDMNKAELVKALNKDDKNQ